MDLQRELEAVQLQFMQQQLEHFMHFVCYFTQWLFSCSKHFMVKAQLNIGDGFLQYCTRLLPYLVSQLLFSSFFIASFFFLLELLSFIVADTAVAVLADVIFTVSLGLSLFSAFVWSLSYEPLVCNTDVKLSQSAMRNEYYKSSNATAYYGPPSGASLMGEQE